MIKKLYEHLDVSGYRAETEKIIKRAETATKEGKLAFMALANVFLNPEDSMQAATIKFFTYPNWTACYYSFDDKCMQNACMSLGLEMLCMSEYEKMDRLTSGANFAMNGTISSMEPALESVLQNLSGTETLYLAYAIYDRKIKGSAAESLFSSNETFIKAYNEFDLEFITKFAVEKLGLATLEEYGKQVGKEIEELSYIRNVDKSAAYFENILPEEKMTTAYKACRNGDKTFKNAQCIEKEGCSIVGQRACDELEKCRTSYEKTKWSALQKYGEKNIDETKRLFLENDEYRKCSYSDDLDCLINILGEKVSFTPLSGDYCKLKENVTEFSQTRPIKENVVKKS